METNTKQWKDKPMVDYPNCWYVLYLNCKDHLMEILVVEMCIQGMY